MGRQQEKTPFQKWESKVADDHHIRLPSFMMKHPNYISLSPRAKELYQYMKDWAYYKKSEFIYSASLAESIPILRANGKKEYIKLMSRPAYYKARDELISAGFLYWKNKPTAQNGKHKHEKGDKCKREKSIFVFVDTWYSGKPYSPPKGKDDDL